MADEQLEWVFDSLVEFLRGPIWNIPVLTFIEQKSVVFEPGAENEDEFKKIHEAYKNLVDFMLGSYMEDLKITPDEFEKSCSVASRKALNQFHQSLFQQVWAADDFEIFRRMMTQKNLELQLQALEFLTQKRGSVPNCMEPAAKVKEEKEMEEIIKKVMEESVSDAVPATPTDTALQEKMKQEAEKEKELLEEAIKQSVRANTPVDTTEEPPAEIKDNEQLDAADDEKSSDINEGNGTNNGKDGCDEQNGHETVEVNGHTLDSTEEDDSNAVEECAEDVGTMKIKENTPASIPSKVLPPLKTHDERPWSEGDTNVYSQVHVEVSPIELERRQNYLRQQRDRILAMKKQERTRRLSTSEEVIAQARPKSARAAKKILREENTEVDPQTLAFRKTLAAKLRSEVVDKTD